MPDQPLHHRIRAMTGRDPHDAHRAGRRWNCCSAWPSSSRSVRRPTSSRTSSPRTTGLVYLFYPLVGDVLDPFHLVLMVGSAVVIAAAVAMAAAGVSLVWCLLVLAATPWVTVVGYETVGHRHAADLLDRIRD